MDQNEAIKTVKRKITDIDSMKIDAQKKAVREGFDMDILSLIHISLPAFALFPEPALSPSMAAM